MRIASSSTITESSRPPSMKPELSINDCWLDITRNHKADIPTDQYAIKKVEEWLRSWFWCWHSVQVDQGKLTTPCNDARRLLNSMVSPAVDEFFFHQRAFGHLYHSDELLNKLTIKEQQRYEWQDKWLPFWEKLLTLMEGLERAALIEGNTWTQESYTENTDDK